MTDGDSGPAPPGWPPPHPSPPLPAPREYGVPGTPRSPARTWALLAGAAAVVVVVLAVVLLLGRGGEADGPSSTPEATASAAAPGRTPSTPAAPSTGASITTAPAAVRCWDGSSAEAVGDCSLPDGEAGLAWLFPHLSEQHCGKAAQSGPGVVTRVLCSSRLEDGSPIQIGYYQWKSVRSALDYYGAQHLIRSETRGFHGWVSGTGGKSALLYPAAPFSMTLRLPAGAVVSAADIQSLLPRPPDEVRGAPVD